MIGERKSSISHIKDGDKEERIFIAANPEYKTLTAFNTGGQRIKLIDFSQKQESKEKRP